MTHPGFEEPNAECKRRRDSIQSRERRREEPGHNGASASTTSASWEGAPWLASYVAVKCLYINEFLRF